MSEPRPPLPLHDRLALGWGKIRRAWLITCRPAYVRRNLARRRGACARTGACCQLMIACPSLRQDGQTYRCSTYLDRGPNCSLFPIDERDLRDRDRIMPDRPCGYRFDPPSASGNGTGRPPRIDFPWEIDGNALGGRVRSSNAFTMALAFVRTAWTILRMPGRNHTERDRPCGEGGERV